MVTMKQILTIALMCMVLAVNGQNGKAVRQKYPVALHKMKDVILELGLDTARPVFNSKPKTDTNYIFKSDTGVYGIVDDFGEMVIITQTEFYFASKLFELKAENSRLRNQLEEIKSLFKSLK